MLTPVLVDLAMLRYEPENRMTPDEAMYHPWILSLQSPSSVAGSSPQPSSYWDHMVDFTRDLAPSTSEARPRPVGAGGRTREGAPHEAGPTLRGSCTVTRAPKVSHCSFCCVVIMTNRFVHTMFDLILDGEKYI